MLTQLKSAVPWWGKIAMKLILARVPISYRQFARLGVFRHGFMDSADYALGVFRDHTRHAPMTPWVGLEFGPGDSVFSAVLAKRSGCQNLWLVDAGDFADKHPSLYRAMAEQLERTQSMEGLVSLCAADDFTTLLAGCGTSYLTQGVASLASIDSESVDLVWSHAVLEHVRVADFERLCEEMYRILRPGGVASHVVDFKDHLGGQLNHLRIPERLWEQDWFAQQSGFYTNRIRFSAMLHCFAQAGFTVEVLYERRWEQAPIGRHELAPEFQSIDPQDLLISDGHFLLRKPQARAKPVPDLPPLNRT
jgi:SAM-dependent methyltransferase